jgi:iron complex transport system substrate-binding protein
MSGFVRPSRLISALAAWALACAAAGAGDRPDRVVSINLCTDQLALLLAEPEQILSVSRMAHDAASSVYVDRARAFPANGSGAEEVFLLRPDLVLAGIYTAPATVQMLRRLGIRVEVFAPAEALADIPDRIARMGAVLGREERAAQVIAAFEADLAALSDAPETRPRVALYAANSFAAGDASLAGDILTAAGFDNVAAEAGISLGGTLPLERLLMLEPDVVIAGADYPGQSRAEDNLAHPAFRSLADRTLPGTLNRRDWTCDTPEVLGAVRALRDMRRDWQAAR